MAIKFLSAIDHGAYQLPTVDGSNGQVLTTDGNGNVTFQSVASSSNYYLSGASFNTSDGVLTLTVSGASNQTVDLDGRYALSSHSHNYDNYQSWNLKTNGTQRTTVQSGGTLDLVAGSNVSLSYSAGGVVTINSSYTNTNYYVDGLSFDTGTGILTASVNGTTNRTVDLDGRYLLTSGKAADSNLLDGIDSGSFLRSDTTDTATGALTFNGNVTFNGSVTQNGVNYGLYHSSIEDAYYFDDYNGSKHLSIFYKNAYSDILRYQPIDNLEYWDGSAWQDMSSQLSNVQNLLDGRKDTSWSVPSTYYKFRFTTNLSSSWPTRSMIWLESSWTGSSYPGCTLTVEENVSGTWTSRVEADFTSSNGITNWGLMARADSALHTGTGSGSNSTRITVDFYGWSPSNSSYTTIPLQNIMITSQFSGSANTDYSTLLNYSKNLTAPAKLYISTVDSNTSSTSALVLNGTEVEQRTLGSNAFNSTSYNPTIGTDTDINTSGADVIDYINVTDGVITSMGSRTLTLAALGFTGDTNANYITNNNQLINGANYAPIATSNYNGTYNIPIYTGGNLYPNPTAGGVTITGSSGLINTPNHGDSSQWNTAYGWGDHSAAGYLTSYTDTNDIDYIDAATFNTSNGIITGTGVGNAGFTVDIDGRYLLRTTDTFTGALTINGYIKGNGQELILSAGESHSVATGQTNEFVYINAESGLQINSSPDNWASGWAGRKTTTINDTSGNSTFAGALFWSGGGSAESNTAYDNMITAAAVSGTTTKTLTLTQQDGGTVTASWTDTDTNDIDYISSASFNTGNGILSLSGIGNAGASVDLDGRYQLAGTYNTIIGTDADIITSGATVIDDIYMTDGVITSHTTRTLTAANLGITQPDPPTLNALNIVGETIEVVFDQSPTPDIDKYEVWSSVNGGSYGLIANIPTEDIAPVMTAIDAAFSVSGTQAYRVYAIKNGIYSVSATGSTTFNAPSLSVVNMSVVNLNPAYYIQYDLPDSRFIDHIEIYMDAETTSSSLSRTGASLIYSGSNSSYMYQIGASDLDKFHQFWVEVVAS